MNAVAPRRNDLRRRRSVHRIGVMTTIDVHPKIGAMPVAEREKLMRERNESAYYGAPRITVARGDDGVAKISLRDALGHPRIVMGVAADGTSSLKFLDAEGKLLDELAPSGHKR